METVPRCVHVLLLFFFEGGGGCAFWPRCFESASTLHGSFLWRRSMCCPSSSSFPYRTKSSVLPRLSAPPTWFTPTSPIKAQSLLSEFQMLFHMEARPRVRLGSICVVASERKSHTLSVGYQLFKLSLGDNCFEYSEYLWTMLFISRHHHLFTLFSSLQYFNIGIMGTIKHCT